MLATQLLPPIPFHLATRGYFGNEYGIATRGYLVFPPIVPRFPSEGVVVEDRLGGWVEERDLFAFIQQDAALLAALQPSIFDLEGILGPLAYQALVEERGELLGVIVQSDQLMALVEAQDALGTAQEDGRLGVVESAENVSSVAEAMPLGAVEDKPGEEGCC